MESQECNNSQQRNKRHEELNQDFRTEKYDNQNKSKNPMNSFKSRTGKDRGKNL